MGGKNHQPCRQYLGTSTLMSRHMSSAFAYLELANVALEDLIIAELDGGIGQINPILDNLFTSDEHLANMLGATAALRQQMRELNYADLPTIESMDLREFGRRCIAVALHRDQNEFGNAAGVMKQQGFYGMLDEFDRRIVTLRQTGMILRQQIADQQDAAVKGTLHLVLEENLEGNFRPTFAQLYTEWANFQQFFLASSLISTEAWYQFNNFGSILRAGMLATKVA